MKTISKAEFIAKVESELPDDAQIIGYSCMGGEFFELDGTGDVFTVLDEDDECRDSVGNATHIFEVT
jgi:hypothetical protein